MTKITPTIGRVVWYYPGGTEEEAADVQPLAAMVAYVHAGGESVNLGFLSSNGVSGHASSVPLRQEGEVRALNTNPFCCWMPYQVKQAAIGEEAERAARARTMAEEAKGKETPPAGKISLTAPIPGKHEKLTAGEKQVVREEKAAEAAFQAEHTPPKK